MEHKLKKGKAEGSVLLTVTGVMFVVVVFMMSTLTLTRAAQRRSYYTYYETQAQFAAQSALDAITSRAYSDADFYNWVMNNVTTPGEQSLIDVEFAGKVLSISNPRRDGEDSSKSTVECTIERLADDNYVWDSANAKIYGQRAWKITATASVGVGKNASQYSVSNYIYANEHRSNAGDASRDTVNWTNYGFTVTSTGDDDEVTYVPGSPSGVASAIYALGKAGSDDNLQSLGPFYYGIGTTPTAPTSHYNTATPTVSPSGYLTTEGNYEYNMQNCSATVGDVVIVGDTRANASGKAFVFESLYEGMSVYGNLWWNNSNMPIYANYKMPASKPYSSLNYIFVSGYFTVSSGDLYVGKNSATENAPVNMYLGGMVNTNSVYTYGDVYLYDPTFCSSITNGQVTTNLSKFVSNNVQKTDAYTVGKNSSKEGGDLVCNNQSLLLGVNTSGSGEVGAHVHIYGDVIMTNPQSTLYIGSRDVQIDGNVICAGNLQTVNGGMGQAKVNGNIYIHGTYTQNGDTTLNKTPNQVTDWKTFLENYTKQQTTVYDMYDEDSDTAGIQSDIVGTQYDLSMMPFASRLDEICKKYYRWDLKESGMATSATMSGYIAAATGKLPGSASSDKAIKESALTGHTWAIETINDEAGTTWHVPYTTPTVAANGFVKELEVTEGLTSSTYELDTSVTPNVMKYTAGQYWADIDQFAKYIDDTQYPGDTETIPDYTTVNAKVSFLCHDKDGNEEAYDGMSVRLIDHSCKLTLEGNGTKYYVDPTIKGKQIVIFLQNYIDNGAQIIVNNTMVNPNVGEADGVKVVTYGSEEDSLPATHVLQKTFTPRNQVIIVMPKRQNEWSCMKKVDIVCTGAYKQLMDLSFDFVANPYYPGKTGYSSLTEAKDLYKFELIPNIVVYCYANETFDWDTGGLITAEVVCPDTTFKDKTNYNNFNVTYRETHESTAYPSNGKALIIAGALYSGESTLHNQIEVAYLGDTFRDGTTSLNPGDPNYEFKDNNTDDSTGNDRGNDDRDYFNNDHLGAN